MKKTQMNLWLAGIVCIALLTGCASTQQAKLYVLHSPQIKVEQAKSPAQVKIVLNKVRLPKHLDRPSIMTHKNKSELHYSEFRRWASPLEDELTRVISLNLSQLLGSSTVASYRFISTEESDYVLDIEVMSMTGTLGKIAELTARWRIWAEKSGESSKIMVVSYAEVLEDSGYDTYVNAQSKMAMALSRDIAVALQAGNPKKQ